MSERLTTESLFKRNFLSAGAIVLCLTMNGCHWVALVSQTSDGVQGNQASYSGELSASGRYVSFHTTSDNLVEGDHATASDVFVRDNLNGTLAHVSVSSTGEAGNRNSISPSLSADGKRVAFSSRATNLVELSTQFDSDVFLHDMQTGNTTLISVGNDGGAANASSGDARISSDGRYVAFRSAATNIAPDGDNGKSHIYLHDTETATSKLVSVSTDGIQANSHSWYPAVSGDGRFVVFESGSTNLISGSTTVYSNIFLHDRDTGVTSLVSVDSYGNPGNSSSYKPEISSNGRYVSFGSSATNLVSNDTNSAYDYFVRDTQTNTTIRVNVDSDGNQTAGDRGNFLVSDISGDGRYVVFQSEAGDLVADDTNGFFDVFVHDIQTGTTRRVSVDPVGNQLGYGASFPSISENGRYVAFGSAASRLVPGDVNGVDDVFIRAISAVQIDTLSPNHLVIGETTSVTISGSGFLPDSAPWFNFGALSNIVIVDENTITADFTIPEDGVPGAYNFGVNILGTDAGLATGVSEVCEGCVTLL